MIRPLLVVRPEPGLSRTSARLRAGGGTVHGWPLFAAAPVDWAVPDPGTHDALLVTSANAIRLAGAGLAALASLPVIAVGAETAAVAAAAGLRVAATGDAGVAAALAAGRAAGLARPLHLAGREHVDSGHPTAIVYASAALPADPRAFAAAAAGHVVLLHSARAAERVATLVAGDRSAIAIAALAPAVAAAAGEGWAGVTVADTPTDAALCARALERAIDRAAGGGDKRA